MKSDGLKIFVDINLCPQNHECPLVLLCPNKAISQTGFYLPVIEYEKCTLCGLCEKKCGKAAIYMA